MSAGIENSVIAEGWQAAAAAARHRLSRPLSVVSDASEPGSTLAARDEADVTGAQAMWGDSDAGVRSVAAADSAPAVNSASVGGAAAAVHAPSEMPRTVTLQENAVDQGRRLSPSLRDRGDLGTTEGTGTDDTAPYSESESDSAGASKPSSLPDTLDGKESDYTDTICSNRSDFFKRYYAAQFSPVKTEASGSPDGYRPLQQIEPSEKAPLQSPPPPPPPAPAQSSPPKVTIKKPPEKQSRVRGLLSKCLGQIRFSWVAMTLLFVVIIASICVIVLQYNIHKSKYAFFGVFKFNEEARWLRLLAEDTGVERARIYVAGMVPNRDMPYDCGLLRSTRVSHTSKYLAESTSDGTGVCLEWKNAARVTIEHVRPEILNCSGSVCRGLQCFRVDWRLLGGSDGLMDCISLTEPGGQLWFGSVETAEAAAQWPLGGRTIPLSPLVTGDVGQHPFGHVVQRYYISNSGVGIYVWNEEPLFQQITKDRLCLANLRRPFPYRYKDDQLQMLYSVCTAPDIAVLHRFGTHVKNPYAKQIEATRRQVWPSFEEIVFHYPGGRNYTQEDVIAYGEDIMSRRYGKRGALVLDVSWQAYQGDLTFDPSKFHNPWKLTSLLQRRGLDLAVTITPLIELKSANIESGIDEKLWIREAISDAPGLVDLAQQGKGAWMDLSNARTRAWLLQKLTAFREQTTVKSVVIDNTAAQRLPFYYNLTEQIRNPDYLAETLHSVAREAGLRVLSVSSVIRPRADAVFAQLSRRPASWHGLQQVLPSVLAATTGGTHLVAPPVVGGDTNRASVGAVELQRQQTAPSDGNISAVVDSSVKGVQAESGVIDEELYARWLQLSCFLPRLQFRLLPHHVSSATERLANILLWQRRKLVLPAFKTALAASLAEGWPIVRPLWHEYPEDPEAAPIADQFLIGTDLLIAPVTQPNVSSRKVYLPEGLWRDVSSGRLDTGGKWIVEKVKPDVIPHYERFRP